MVFYCTANRSQEFIGNIYFNQVFYLAISRCPSSQHHFHETEQHDHKKRGLAPKVVPPEKLENKTAIAFLFFFFLACDTDATHPTA